MVETVVHVVLFSGNSFWDALLFNLSPHELFMRIITLISCGMLYLLVTKNKIIKDKESQIKNILNNVIPVCITNRDYRIVMANDSYWSIWGKTGSRSLKCYEHRPGENCHTDKCLLRQIMSGAREYVCESKKEYNNETHDYILTAKPFYDSKNRVAGIIESFQDITARKKLENEKEQLIGQLQDSLAKVKLLSGFLPICASCKKIRDDQGYWKQIEGYIKEHSEAEFSHGICPECARKLYPDYMDTVQ